VLLALATSNKIWLAVFAGIFIAFSLVASFVFPRRNPDFPGERGRNWFVVVTIALFVAMMFAVTVFASEDEEAQGGEAAAETTGQGEGEPTSERPVRGDAAAGRTLFMSLGCGSCHAFAAAGTDASVGPNLDESLEGDDADHIRESIVNPRADVERGFPPIMPAEFGDLSAKQLDDLIAFLSGAPEQGETEPAETQPAETGGAPPGGNVDAGETVFASQGCGGCHAFSAAGSDATTGPNLDESLQGDDPASIRESIVDPRAQVVSGFPPIMPTDYGEKLSQKQLDDLIAFLRQ
jgi:cytochrome c2